MTPEERAANSVIGEHLGRFVRNTELAVVAAIVAAVEAEREACAKELEGKAAVYRKRRKEFLGQGCTTLADDHRVAAANFDLAADAIRKRKENPPEPHYTRGPARQVLGH